MNKKKKLECIEFCINKAQKLIDILPKTGEAYLMKAKKEHDQLFKNNGKPKKYYETLKSIESISNRYVNLY